MLQPEQIIQKAYPNLDADQWRNFLQVCEQKPELISQSVERSRPTDSDTGRNYEKILSQLQLTIWNCRSMEEKNRALKQANTEHPELRDMIQSKIVPYQKDIGFAGRVNMKFSDGNIIVMIAPVKLKWLDAVNYALTVKPDLNLSSVRTYLTQMMKTGHEPEDLGKALLMNDEPKTSQRSPYSLALAFRFLDRFCRDIRSDYLAELLDKHRFIYRVMESINKQTAPKKRSPPVDRPPLLEESVGDPLLSLDLLQVYVQRVKEASKRTISATENVQSDQTKAANARLSNIIKCCKCGYETGTYEGDSPFKCPECGTTICTLCHCQHHPGLTCEQARNKTQSAVERMSIHQCPKCRQPFVKEEGCNRMECPRCHTTQCYRCRQVIDPSVGYKHFYRGTGIAPPGECPLWVDNAHRNQTEAKVIDT